LHLWSLRQNK